MHSAVIYRHSSIQNLSAYVGKNVGLASDFSLFIIIKKAQDLVQKILCHHFLLSFASSEYP